MGAPPIPGDKRVVDVPLRSMVVKRHISALCLAIPCSGVPLAMSVVVGRDVSVSGLVIRRRAFRSA